MQRLAGSWCVWAVLLALFLSGPGGALCQGGASSATKPGVTPPPTRAATAEEEVLLELLKNDTASLGNVKSFVKKGFNVNAQHVADRNKSALQYAATNDRLKIVQFLLKSGADVNSIDTLKTTPLHEAAGTAGPRTVKSLLAAGANPNAQLIIGWLPLHMAASFQNTKAVALLVGAGSRLDRQDINGMSPLHWSVMVGDTVTIRLLVASKAKVNSQNNKGETPLHEAARLGFLDIIQILAKAGAEDTQNDAGVFASDLICSDGTCTTADQQEITRIFEQDIKKVPRNLGGGIP